MINILDGRMLASRGATLACRWRRLVGLSSRTSTPWACWSRLRITTHSVGHCQRSGAVVEPRLSLQWFVSTKPLADRAMAAAQWRNADRAEAV